MKAVLAACLSLPLLSTSVMAQSEAPVAGNTVRRHMLKVAASPNMGYSNATVDAILARMTAFLQRSDFGWDIACGRVEIVRDGDLIRNSALPTSGSADELAEAMAQHAPAANVLVVSQITDCGGVFAAGCAPIRPDKRDSLAVTHDGTSRGPIVWLHERGHVLGLGHVAQGANSSSATEQERGQVMFWNPSPQSTGVLQPTCDRFRAAFTSAPAVPSAGTVATMALANSSSIDALNLSPAASAVVASAWSHGAPITEIEALTDADLDTVERAAAGAPNPWTRQLLLILAYRRPDSRRVLSIAREHADRAVAVAATTNADALERQREGVGARLAGVYVLGIIGARASDPTAASAALEDLARPRDVATAGALDLSRDISATALEASALVAGRSADQIDNTTAASLRRINPGFFGDAPTTGGVRAISPAEARKLQAIQDSVRRKGVSGFLATGTK